MKILLTGASGFLGKKLSQKLADEGHELLVLARHPSPYPTLLWNAETFDSFDPSEEKLKGVEVLIHLAGESIASKRWSAKRKETLYRSRVYGTQKLLHELSVVGVKPKVILSASAVGFYGNLSQGVLTEESPAGQDFLAGLCRDWEAAVLNSPFAETRKVLLRFGMILGIQGGALAKMIPLFRLGLGGKLGNGQQPMSWIHLKDAIDAILFSLKDSRVSGPVNVSAPTSVTNAYFTHALGRTLKRPSFFAVPRSLLKAAVGEVAEVLLGGQRAYPQKLLELGFRFEFPFLSDAFQDLFCKNS